MQFAFSLPSYAKINCFLRIVGKRVDGFHELVTVFQTISLHDTITFAAEDGLSLSCEDPGIPVDASNLILKAAIALQNAAGCRDGARITLDKLIPSPGGLGGGSSNAAVTLLGLARLWNITINDGGLDQIAAELGSDVPYFLHGGTALGTRRGDKVEPLPDIDEKYMLVVTPDISISTAEAFERLGAPNLTIEAANRILRVCRLEAELRDLRRTALINDFEPSVFSAYPEIKRVKETLLDLGAVNAAMSGSGASVFAIFDKQETRQTAEKALDIESTWRKFAVATIGRSEYRDALHP